MAKEILLAYGRRGQGWVAPAVRGQGVGAALDYFISKGQIPDRDGGQVTWYHAANSKASTAEALKSAAHMIEADVLLRGHEPREPIMAHPPHSDSDITLQDWLNEVLLSDKGIKLDFKSLEAVQSSIRLLESVKSQQSRPLWINADILPGPNGSPGQAVEAKGFLDSVCPVTPHAVLSLGWTTGWSPQTENHGYSWEMVKEMEQICGALPQPVTFPVRAALLRQSFTQLHWLLQQSDRYSLSIWTGKDDVYPVEDLLYLRNNFDKSRIFYDITEAQDAAFKKAIGYSSIVK